MNLLKNIYYQNITIYKFNFHFFHLFFIFIQIINNLQTLYLDFINLIIFIF